ncbi:DNA repair protein uvh3-like [Trifolium pratense]|uniref:DNA repair protein uvh3-like n=1 Tax=Trifolium pratense TaxID=57577 RepID=A0A2K3NRA5_TRIPR|nr:DNA repair protein uvh3-like [Trifolium pratense]
MPVLDGIDLLLTPLTMNNARHPIHYFQDPSKFSELQIQAYLKTVAFHREINEVQIAAVGGVGGVLTSWIASEVNRVYIFSSSFSRDKHLVGVISMDHSHADDNVVKVQPSGSDSDCDWEEGTVQDENTIFPGHNKLELKSSVAGRWL